MKLFYPFIFILILFSCSTEKNTLINRTYHSTTARYNGYFNANELLKDALTSYQNNRKEDYYTLIPLNPLPNEEEVKGLLPAIDTAISKCTKVIGKHSMPTASEPVKKKDEFNTWIDENWLTIGYSNFYKRDFEKAEKSFKYVNKFFQNDPSSFTASIWLAKTYIQINDFNQASIILLELEKKKEKLEAEKTAQKSEQNSNLKKNKNSKKDKKAVFTTQDKFLFEKTKAELAILQKDYSKAIEFLENALKHTKNSKEKGRIHFVLAQLNATSQKYDIAKTHYSKCLKYNIPFEMHFNARINRAIMGGDEKIKKELHKMLRDEKNIEYKDQIYFALADIALKEPNLEKGIELLHQSVIYSFTNTRQKAQSYEKLGDLSFSSRNYIKSQKYYDSCVKVMPSTYPNADGLKNKAIKLKDLVVAVETAAFEDSVQRISKLSKEDQLAFAEKLIKKMAEDEKKRKEQEAIRLREIQSQQALTNEPVSGNKFFWNSPKLKSEGLEIFKKQWGSRENEDDWRRSEKMPVIKNSSNPNDSLGAIENQVVENGTVTPEKLLSNIPNSDSTFEASTQRMLSAYYEAGLIYKDLLNEIGLATKQFETILNHKAKSDFNLLALYQLYKINENTNQEKANEYRNEILASYPESDFANYLRDSDYFLKKKAIDQLAEEDYLKILDRYNRGLYSLVLSSADQVIENEKKNQFRSKYMLLKAMSIGQTTHNKSQMLPVLSQLIKEYPNSPEEKRAKELLEINEKGYSTYQEKEFTNKSIFTYKENETHYVLVFLEKEINASTAKARVADFNKDIFSKERLSVNPSIFNSNQNILIIKDMTESVALDYIKTFKKTKKLMEVQKMKIMAINQENMKLLFETNKLTEYESFYAEFY